ncbi:uncharacterized protein B0T23DRAFT_60486 [Neurospora hispaniola]|uniref:Uncharacterized protein n=1 Tax=Neurospora hispaniola TaxID=588809 RepID=A0AAJ0IBH7_9PEZI|nr:hypothetical protein B0T23DRAFT_60486 [Neurospora hispaniola]
MAYLLNLCLQSAAGMECSWLLPFFVIAVTATVTSTRLFLRLPLSHTFSEKSPSLELRQSANTTTTHLGSRPSRPIHPVISQDAMLIFGLCCMYSTSLYPRDPIIAKSIKPNWFKKTALVIARTRFSPSDTRHQVQLSCLPMMRPISST